MEREEVCDIKVYIVSRIYWDIFFVWNNNNRKWIIVNIKILNIGKSCYFGFF